MSRSNGYEPQPGAGQQPGGFNSNTDPRALDPHAAPQQRPAAQQPAGYAQPGAYPAQVGVPPMDAYGQQFGYQQQAPAPGYGLAPQQPAAPTRQSASYAPKFDAYVPPSQGQSAASQPYRPQQQPAADLYAQVRAQQAPQQTAPAPQDFRGAVYDQWPAPTQPQAQPQYDPRAYDLSSYSQPYGQLAQPAPYGQPGLSVEDPTLAHPGSYDATGYTFQPGQIPGQEYAPQQQGYSQDGQDHQEYAEEGEEYEDDTPRRSRSFMIAATLAGAIFVGGGLTYAYNSLLGGGAGGPTPVVKSAEGPAKVKPSEPGGKQFAHSDSKVLGRLTENNASGDVDPSGAKRVSTLVVKPDGTIAPPAAAPAEVSAATMPGMSVVNVGGPPIEAPSLATSAVETASTSAAPADKPMVVAPPAATPPKAAKAINSVQTLNSAAAAQPDIAAAAPVKKPDAPKKVAAVTTPAVADTVAKAAAPSVSTGTGYMAVVASVPAGANSRVTALSRWADMQQKYGTILQNKQPDVQEANLGEKGTYHRLLVGPPGSKDGANSVCTQLKAAGHTDCWVMSF